MLLLLVLLAACKDAQDPCPDGCSGPVDLVVDYVIVELPRRNGPAYSGDTLRLQARVTNRGGVAFNSTGRLVLYAARQGSVVELELGRISAGGRVRFDTLLALPYFTRPEITRDSIVPLLRFAVDSARPTTFPPLGPWVFEYETREGPPSSTFAVTPNTFELQGVPNPLRFPSSQIIRVVYRNHSPHVIPAGALGLCIVDGDHCFFQSVAPILFESLAPGEVRTAPALLEVLRRDDARFLWEVRPNVQLRACYRHERTDPELCRFTPTDLAPDYERFCAVRRLLPNTPISTTTTGRCGAGVRIHADDLLSFDAAAGSSFEITTSAVNSHRVFIYSAAGVLKAASPNWQPHHRLRITVDTAGRYYIAVLTAGDYTISLEPT